jgi:hypothetical protein
MRLSSSLQEKKNQKCVNIEDFLFRCELIDWCLTPTLAIFFSNGAWRIRYHILLMNV